MDLMTYHAMKVRELQQYRRDRKKANIIADILTVIILLGCCGIWYLCFKCGV